MISKDCTITIDKGNASVDEDVYLYKNDMNIQILFTIVNNKYRYTKNTAIDNIIANNKASYAQVKFKKGDIEIDFEEQETKDGAVVLLIKKELIDEDTELGDYSIQIRLFDENKTSVITLPPVENCIHIQRPLFEKAGEDTNEDTNIVDQALTDMAVVTYAEPISATNSDGTYNKKTWISKEKITTAELNRMEEGISDVSSQCKDIVNEIGKNEDGSDIELPTTNKTIKGAINEISDKLKDKSNKDDVAKISSGTPLFASNLDEMTDITKNYVNTSDGYLYVYNNTNFIKSDVMYQSMGIADKSIDYSKLNDGLKNIINYKNYNILNTFKCAKLNDNGMSVPLLSNSGTLRGLAVNLSINSQISQIKLYSYSDVANTVTCYIMTDPTNDSTILGSSVANIDTSEKWIEFNFSNIPTVDNVWVAFVCENGHSLASCHDSTYLNVYDGIKYCPQNALDFDFRDVAGTYTPVFSVLSKKLKIEYNDSENIKNIMSEVVNISVYDNKKKKIKLLGDSITHGQGGTGFLQDGDTIPCVVGSTTWKMNTNGYCWANNFKKYMEEKFCCTVKNYGCAGLTSGGLLTNIHTLIEDDDDIIIIMIGTNDRSSLYIKDLLRKRIINIYNYITNYGKKVIFMANIPSSIKNEESQTVIHMEDINNIIMGACSSLGIEYISLYNDFIDYCENTGVTIDSLLVDGLHPNDKGYDVMLNIILKRLGLSPKRIGSTW